MKRSVLLSTLMASNIFLIYGCSPDEMSDKKKHLITKSIQKTIPKESRVLKLAKKIVKEKGNINQSYNSRFSKDDKGLPILVWAIAKYDMEAVKFLLDNGADPNVKLIARSTDTAIFESCPSVDIETSVADYNARRDNTRQICELLINAGADVKYKNQLGETILHKAAGKGRDDICELLIENGADIKSTDRMGTTPLHNASKYASCKVVELLILKGADVNAKDRLQKTPLKLAEERLEEDLHKKIRKEIPTAYPFTDYDKVIKMLKVAGGK